MAVYSIPLFPCPSKFGMQMSGNVMINQSPLNKAVQTVEFPGDLWIVRAEFPPVMHHELGAVEAFWNRFRGIAHQLRIWHMLRPVPVGTMRGTPYLNGASPEGANYTNITTTPGETILAGDMLNITLSNGRLQLIQVVGVPHYFGVGGPDGRVQIDFTPPLRRFCNSGAPVYWNKPYVDCMVTSPPFITGVPVVSEGFTIEAVEVPA